MTAVRFTKTGRVYYFDPGVLPLRRGQWVVVETQHGPEVGQVTMEPRELPAEQVPRPLRPVMRMATPSDLSGWQQWRSKEPAAFQVGLEKIRRHNLPMRLIDTEYAFDGGRLTFYFSAEGRVDFRELVRDLASHFRTRIELRQIGSRDVARMVGGIGPCGLPTCCSTFMTALRPVTLRMAKDQGLALNPEKLSGLCGRLMCCLSFELELAHPPAAAAEADEEGSAEAPSEEALCPARQVPGCPLVAHQAAAAVAAGPQGPAPVRPPARRRRRRRQRGYPGA